jgi:predicted deacylase
MTALPARPFSAGDFPELDTLRTLELRAGAALRAQTLCEVTANGERLPVQVIELGSTAPDVPAIGFFGGVHGVERIGTQVVLAYLHTLVERLQWDDTLPPLLEQVRLVFMPLVNPGGMLRRTRANPAGVDLMRNGPNDADCRVPWLLGGHRLGPWLPWYRGRRDAPMEPEARALCEVVEQRLLGQPFSIALDCHSGFGTRDQIWFPHAGSHKPIDCLADIYALRTMFRSTHPFHSIYVIEPQSRRYVTHGDLWDWLYARSQGLGRGLFLPFTLEMGSWLWVKKNPLQLFGRLGMFNPIETHRMHRNLRRHLTFLDFLVRAAASHRRWRPREDQRQALFDSAVSYWMSRPESVTAVR